MSRVSPARKKWYITAELASEQLTIRVADETL
jgi:hypothetical protein